jgi:putative protease
MILRGKIKKPELLAPAGNILKMKTAFAFGADAVYLGIPDFSLRVRINDFKISDIRKAIKYTRKINKKIYITINIFAHNAHIKKLPKYIKILRELKPDGLFISDPGIMTVIKKEWPKANIILSTQANCTNLESARFWHKQGIKRIILGRELGLKEIREIKKALPGLELEAFVHGALCMAYSGRCFISKLINGRDANLGDCSQPCRWEYGVESVEVKAKGHDEIFKLIEEKHGTYILNSNDLCLIKRLPELINVGIDAFKIEGRAKSVYYLANVVGAYRRAIDVVVHNTKHETCNTDKIYKNSVIKNELAFLYSELEDKLFHRGYTEGFMFNQGKIAQNLDNSHNSPKWEFCGVILSIKKIKNKRIAKIKVHNTMKIGDEIEIIRPGYDIVKIVLKKMINAKTKKEQEEAHGGGSGDVVLVEVKEDIPEHSVLRRKI